MAHEADDKRKGRKGLGRRLGPDTWQRDGKPHYAALLVQRLTHPTDNLGEPYFIEPVLALNAQTAVQDFNTDPTRNPSDERAVTVITLFTNMSGGGPDHPMRVLTQRAFHFVYEHAGESGEDDIDDPAMLDLVFHAVEQGMVRAYMAGLVARDQSPRSPRR